jgi:hypothetical protein
MHWNKFRKIRNEVTSLVRNAKDKYNNDLISLGLIKSGIDGFVEFITFRTSSTSFSHNLISLIWFVTCDKLGILLLESSISDPHALE